MNGRVEEMHCLYYVFVCLIYNRMAYHADNTVGDFIAYAYVADTGMELLYWQLVW